MNKEINNKLIALRNSLTGKLYFDDLAKAIYATDASVYRKIPLAVALPKTDDDIKLLIQFATKNNTSLVPRTAGTSLAGQCVGDGIVVDVSKHFTNIISINQDNQTVSLQPGVIRDELNIYLKPFGLFFGPNTSTSNRCMMGGMVGNNSSGTTSIQYGVTRDKVVELKTILSDGSEAIFGELSSDEFYKKLKLKNLEGEIYRAVYKELNDSQVQRRIFDKFPKKEIHRRNTGYAIDELVNSEVFTGSKEKFNMCKLLSGSEGTLVFITEITLKLDKLPPRHSIMIAAHFSSIENCMRAVKPIMKHNLYTCEMMDKTILDCTKQNKTQLENRQFIVGDPQAILMCEVMADSENEVETLANDLLQTLKQIKLSFANPILKGADIKKASELRKAGLGLLGNIVGDKKAVACIEDTAVTLDDLSEYISDFSELMKTYDQEPVYYAHAGAGELHLRPILDLKKTEDVILFRKITSDVAALVKKYKGSFSGEHGDGIARSEFIPFMIGEDNYSILKRIKWTFDSKNIFNPGKIVHPYRMDNSFRYKAGREEPEVKTIMDFSSSLGILREAEKCNGSGDCRKLPEAGGTMCPSYRATLNEKDTTRARANALREFLTKSDEENKFDHSELKEVFDLCMSCKACSSECPSSVDVAALKAEFLYQYQKSNGVSLRTKLFAFNNRTNKIGSAFPDLTNFIYSNPITSLLIKKIMGIAKQRSLPKISNNSLNKVYYNLYNQKVTNNYIRSIYLFNDEFTNFLDTDIGVDTIELLNALNYKVILVDHFESGRAFLSKGLLEHAKEFANKNVAVFKNLISEGTPLIGIEPSAILTFKDEYLRLANDKESAKQIANNTFLIEEFISNEIAVGNIKSSQFNSDVRTIKFHGHCHQKALSNQIHSFNVLNLPKNYKVTIIPSGCCGMAGSFGYEKEHYDVSMKVGEQTLFPAVRRAPESVIISANGTSCRHQIKDGTNRIAQHPISILRRALA